MIFRIVIFILNFNTFNVKCFAGCESFLKRMFRCSTPLMVYGKSDDEGFVGRVENLISKEKKILDKLHGEGELTSSKIQEKADEIQEKGLSLKGEFERLGMDDDDNSVARKVIKFVNITGSYKFLLDCPEMEKDGMHIDPSVRLSVIGDVVNNLPSGNQEGNQERYDTSMRQPMTKKEYDFMLSNREKLVKNNKGAPKQKEFGFVHKDINGKVIGGLTMEEVKTRGISSELFESVKGKPKKENSVNPLHASYYLDTDLKKYKVIHTRY